MLHSTLAWVPMAVPSVEVHWPVLLERQRYVVSRCLEHGVMVLQAGPDVVRLAPSLVIEREELEVGLARLEMAAKQLCFLSE